MSKILLSFLILLHTSFQLNCMNMFSKWWSNGEKKIENYEENILYKTPFIKPSIKNKNILSNNPVKSTAIMLSLSQYDKDGQIEKKLTNELGWFLGKAASLGLFAQKDLVLKVSNNLNKNIDPYKSEKNDSDFFIESLKKEKLDKEGIKKAVCYETRNCITFLRSNSHSFCDEIMKEGVIATVLLSVGGKKTLKKIIHDIYEDAHEKKGKENKTIVDVLTLVTLKELEKRKKEKDTITLES